MSSNAEAVSPEEPVIVTQTGTIRTLTMNRPERRNALDDHLVAALDAELTAAENDPATHCVVLAGKGRSFCAGADLQFFLGLHEQFGTPIAFLRRVSALVTRLEESPLPIVAALHGHAVAGGLELALGCDIVVAASDTLIGDGHVRNNLLPAGGSSVRLPRKVGDAMARWLALTGELITPDRLAATGWIHSIVSAEHLQSSALAIATQLTERSGPAQSGFKSLLSDLTTMNSAEGLAAELDAFDSHWAANDVPASLNAFLARKVPSHTTTENQRNKMNRYQNQVVLVTGGAQGLGAAMAIRFASEGATVAIGDVNVDVATTLASELTETYGSACVAHRVDVTDSTSVNEWVTQIAAELGRIDVLVNNAGIIRDNKIDDIDDADWRTVLDASLTGSFYCTRAVLPHMRSRQYGRIVSFSSMSWRGNYGQANYVAAKAGIVGLTRTIALETARHGITANAIAPGLIETPMLASMNAPARDKLISKVPQRKTGQPEDIAEAAAYLCSPAAGYVSGIVLDVDGGLGIGSSIR